MKERKNLPLPPFNIPSQGLSNLILHIVMRGGQGRFHHAHFIEEKTKAELASRVQGAQHRTGRGKVHTQPVCTPRISVECFVELCKERASM